MGFMEKKGNFDESNKYNVLRISLLNIQHTLNTNFKVLLTILNGCDRINERIQHFLGNLSTMEFSI